MKKVSVIIPSKNRFRFIEESLISVFSQKLEARIKLRVIVVDDLSDPPLEQVLKINFPQTKFYKNEKTIHGPGSSRNVGLANAKGDYIAFLDNDDQWKPDFLQSSINLLAKKKKATATVCLTDPYFFGDFPLGKKLKLKILNFVRTGMLLFFYVFNNGYLPKSAFYLCQISHILFRGDIKNYKFNETVAAAEDWEFNVDATSVKSFAIIPRPLVKFRYELSSNTFSGKVKKGKKKAYYDLLEKLPESHKGVMSLLFKWYIRFFLVK